MRFSYDGFEQLNGLRRNIFLGLEDGRPHRRFCISTELTLLSRNAVSLQEIPHLCAKLLDEANKADAGVLDGYEDYIVKEDDLLLFTAPRRAQALERSKRKYSHHKSPKSAFSESPWHGTKP